MHMKGIPETTGSKNAPDQSSAEPSSCENSYLLNGINNITMPYMDMLPDPTLIVRDMKIVYSSNSAKIFLSGNMNNDLTGSSFLDYFLPCSSADIADVFMHVKGFTGKTCSCMAYPSFQDNNTGEVEILLTGLDKYISGGALCVLHEIFSNDRDDYLIRESEKRYRTIFDSTGTAMLFIEDDMTISLANCELETITGYLREDIVGKKKWTEFVSARDLQRLVSYHDLRRKDPDLAPRNYEFLLKHADGGYRNIYMTISMVPGTQQSVGSLIDLTDIKETENALASTEERYNFLAENAREVIIVYDLDGYITYINRAGCEISGIPREEVLNKKINDIFPLSSNINMYKALAENRVRYDEIFINKTGFTDKNGNILDMETSSTVIRVNEKPEAILVIARDITERKRIEREVLKMSEGIREQVGRDLHDDLSPHLIGIEAMTEVLRMKLEECSSQYITDVKKISSLINGAIKKTRRLIRGLCPVELGTAGLSSALFNLSERISMIYSIECNYRGTIDVSIDDNITAINLYYIAQEAAYNAVKHSGAEKIDISIKIDLQNLVLNITDNGSGISLPLPKSGGRGLSIMKHRAEILNGSLTISHSEQGGTSVTCFIPLTAPGVSRIHNNET